MTDNTNDLIDEGTEEEAGETEEGTEELDETSEETAQTIAEYQSKIDALDEQLAEIQTEKVGGMRFKALIDANYTEFQAERYVDLIDGNTADEITESIETFKEDIPPPKNYINQSFMGSGRGRPQASSYEKRVNVGREAVRKIIGKVRL